jgi:ABC-type transporter Mla MlaB component
MQDASPGGRLILDGALTIRNAAAICATLRDNIERYPVVSIDCSAAAEVDVSFVQLLLASRASATRSGRSVALAARPDGALLNALTRAGFHTTPDNRTEAQGFWFAGAAE